MLTNLVKTAPVIGSGYGFVKTAINVSNATTPAGAVRACVKGIIIDCTPPVIKYPVLCAGLVVNGAICVTTQGNPLAVSILVTNARLIIEP